MTERLEQTRALLARHHRDGERFARLMREGFDNRFDEAFWADWDASVMSVCGERPTILDLGAGPGVFVQRVAERYPQARVVGVECAPYMLEAVGELPGNGEMVCEDLHDPRLPLARGEVDAAMASVVLHEMNQPLRLLQELARCMKRGGRLLVLDWVRAPLEVYVRAQTDEARLFDPATPVAELEDLFVHFIEHNRFSREDLFYLLNHTGFAVLESSVAKEGRYARILAERR